MFNDASRLFQQSHRQGHGAASSRHAINHLFSTSGSITSRSSSEVYNSGQRTKAPLKSTREKTPKSGDYTGLLIQSHGSMGRSERSFAITSGRLQLWRHNLRYEAFKFCRSPKLCLQMELVTSWTFPRLRRTGDHQPNNCGRRRLRKLY